MNHIRRICFFAVLMGFGFFGRSQSNPDNIVMSNIRTVRFHMYNDQLSIPVYKLNSDDRLELHFDDMDGNVKSYYYTYQLCDFDWNPIEISPFDYIKGFTQSRISTYRYSSIAYTGYTHYQAILPESNSVPTMSGNYLLKVFLDGDTSKLAFTRRLYVLNPKTSISAQIIQPFLPDKFNTHQRLRFSLNIDGLKAFNANQEIRVVVMQNNRWDNAQSGVRPTFIRGNMLEYNSESDFVFPGGKEWRWLDMRSLKLQGDRVAKAVYKKDSTDVYVKTDGERASQQYVYFQDLNGMYDVITYENINPLWQGDYATAHFNFFPSDGIPFKDKDLYIFGQLTDYQLNETNKMSFNEEKEVYEKSLFLKQGYYSYGYMLVDRSNPAIREELDGNHFETENNYTILVYYKSFSDRSDELVGLAKIDSRLDRAGFSF